MPWGGGVWARVYAQVGYTKERTRASRRKWRQLIKELRASAKAFPDGGVVLNESREIVNYNKAARQLLGLKKKRDRGQRIENLLRHPDFVTYAAHADRRKSIEIPAPGGGEGWLSCRIIPYGPGQSLLLVRDITQTVKMEAMRRDFVANASHELRSPLTVIAGYLETLSEDDALPENWQGPVADMRAQANRMSELVRDLLRLAKLESSESCTDNQVVDIVGLLTSARKDALASPQHPERIELVFDSKNKILGDKLEIQSIVSNLLSNAIRYTPQDGSVTITWGEDKHGGYLNFTDTGIGIAAEDLPRLTERFYRADGGRDREKGGTGLGLAIVKHALMRHDARLEVRSQLGKGSSFICHFPPERLAPA
jgi:two-component system phosphate regulon sensor histidine kinase PhoR